MTDPPEVCICAALEFPDGYIVYGHRHSDAIRAAAEMGRDPREAEQGFITTGERFVLRQAAAELQHRARRKSVDPNRSPFPSVLFSEDLY